MAVPLVWLSVPAAAQIADPYRASTPTAIDPVLGAEAIDVTERARQDFAPVGGRLGSFFLYPTLDVTADYDDNIFGVDGGKVGDVLITTKVGASLESRWSRHRLSVDGYELVNRYTNLKSQNSEGYGGHLGGQYDIDHASRALLDVSYSRGPEDRLSVNGVNASEEPIIFSVLSASARVDKGFGQFVVTGRAQHNRFNYEDGRTFGGFVFPQAFRNLRRDLFTGIVQYKAQGGLTAIVAATYDTLDYPILTLVDRNSTGYRIEAGVGIELSKVLSGEIRIGYLSRNNVDPAVRNPSGLSFFANMLWNVTRTVSLRLNADRDIDQSGSTIAAGNIRSEVKLTGGWEARRNVIVLPTLRYAHIDPVGLPAANDEYEARLRTTYILNRRYRLFGEVGHYDRTAGQYPAATANSALLGFGVRL